MKPFYDMDRDPLFYAISLNPSIDCTFYLPEIVFDDINRIQKSRVDAGGKGLNVARMLTSLNCKTVALVFLGGDNGEALKKLLLDEKVEYKYVSTEGNVRKVFNFVSGKTVLRFNEKGPSISFSEKKLFFALFEDTPFKKGDVVVASGSLPPGMGPSVYGDIVKKVKEKGACAVLDTDGQALSAGVKAAPDMIKPNFWELQRIAGHKIGSAGVLKNVAGSLEKKGIKTVLLTLGAHGAMLFSRGKAVCARVPKVEVLSTVGCGDVFLAGFLYGISASKSEREALKFAAAAGTAKVQTEGTSMPRFADIVKMAEKVRVKTVDEREMELILKGVKKEAGR